MSETHVAGLHQGPPDDLVDEIRKRHDKMMFDATLHGLASPPPAWLDVGILLAKLAAADRALSENTSAHEQWVREHQAEVDGAHRQRQATEDRANRHVTRLQACDDEIERLQEYAAWLAAYDAALAKNPVTHPSGETPGPVACDRVQEKASGEGVKGPSAFPNPSNSEALLRIEQLLLYDLEEALTPSECAMLADRIVATLRQGSLNETVTPLTIDVDKDCRRYRWMKANMRIQPMFPLPGEAKPQVTVKLPTYDRRDGRLEWALPGAEQLDAVIDAAISESLLAIRTADAVCGLCGGTGRLGDRMMSDCPRCGLSLTPRTAFPSTGNAA